MLEHGADGRAAIGAAAQILRREPPRLRGREPGEPIDHAGHGRSRSSKEIVAALDDSYLFIQGPPGLGQDLPGARLIVDLIERGKRVGVTSTSHKAIHNLLDEVEEVADEQGLELPGPEEVHRGQPRVRVRLSQHGLIESVDDNGALSDPEVDLTAGTAWHYCREDTDDARLPLHRRGGQISLADALALGTAARNVVLLGDPQQLPQVTQGAHPAGSSLSVLEHLLGDAQTIDARAAASSSSRPAACTPTSASFVSELMYDGRLDSAPGLRAPADRRRRAS